MVVEEVHDATPPNLVILSKTVLITECVLIIGLTTMQPAITLALSHYRNYFEMEGMIRYRSTKINSL
jgi:hypothetical protein